VFPVRYELGFYIPEYGILHSHREKISNLTLTEIDISSYIKNDGLEKKAELRQHNSVFLKTVSTKLYRVSFTSATQKAGFAAIAEPLIITESNAQMCRRWCHDHKTGH
jgi:hypothetical protein